MLPIVQTALGAQVLVNSILLALWSKPAPSASEGKLSRVGAGDGGNQFGQTYTRSDMRRSMMLALLYGLLGSMPLPAEETAFLWAPTGSPDFQVCPFLDPVPAALDQPSTDREICQVEVSPVQAPAWQPAWGVAGLRVIPQGARIAPSGDEYHPNFSLDLDFNFWLWRSQGLYMFADISLWGEKGEYGVTNGRDGFMGTSKREFDLSGGAAWNYAGPWEARAFGYTYNNLNRGASQITPFGFCDGFGLENRYYLSPEYAKLGQPGFDVARATFLSIGYYPSKVMVGNDGQAFQPGMMLRAYLIYDLWDLPCYVYGDVTYISESSFQPKLLLSDVGLAARPFRSCQQFEFRLGADNTGDFQVHNIKSLWYASFRFIF